MSIVYDPMPHLRLQRDRLPHSETLGPSYWLAVAGVEDVGVKPLVVAVAVASEEAPIRPERHWLGLVVTPRSSV